MCGCERGWNGVVVREEGAVWVWERRGRCEYERGGGGVSMRGEGMV